MDKQLGLTSLDIFNMVKELQPLVGGRLNKFYQLKNRFTLRINRDGTHNLNIVLPGLMFLSESLKYAAESATPLSMGVRKYIINGFVRSISQSGCERIVRLEFEKGGDVYTLIIELFSKGNMLLVDKGNKIIALYSTQAWSTRTIKQGQDYQSPPAIGGFAASESEIAALLQKTAQESMVKFIAVEIGLGGHYAEEVCAIGGFDKASMAATAKQIHAAIAKLISQKVSPHFYESFMSSYPLKGFEGKGFDTMSSMAEEYISGTDSKKPGPGAAAIKRIEGVVSQQRAAMESLEKAAVENTRKGELVYENYTQIQQILEQASAIQKSRGWEACFEFLRKHPKVSAVSQKELSFLYKA
jgi:predicted ribosome quality control (RQC) complex YloA/Tae2 family protein